MANESLDDEQSVARPLFCPRAVRTGKLRILRLTIRLHKGCQVAHLLTRPDAKHVLLDCSADHPRIVL